MKSEPDVFSIDHLQSAKDQKTMWEGVRNYTARNYMRDTMKVGDGVLFYHSNANPPCIVGTAEIASESYPDPTQFNPDSDYFDAKSSEDNPRWFLVDVKFKQKFNHIVNREVLQHHPILKDMVIFKLNRLSITPVTEQEWLLVHELSLTKPL
ncbi:EVE domain-containing protein [bacterium]|nr:MAG: EVE domain-containing protein [bacterium]